MTKTIHFYVETHTHKTRWWWLCVWQGPFLDAEMNFTAFENRLPSVSVMWMCTVTNLSSCHLHLLCFFSFLHWLKSDRCLSALSPSWPLQQCRQGQPRHGHCSPPEAFAMNSLFFSLWQWHLSVWRAFYDSPVLYHFGPIRVWDLSGMSERQLETQETERATERFKVHFSFAVPSGDDERANNNRS